MKEEEIKVIKTFKYSSSGYVLVEGNWSCKLECKYGSWSSVGVTPEEAEEKSLLELKKMIDKIRIDEEELSKQSNPVEFTLRY